MNICRYTRPDPKPHREKRARKPLTPRCVCGHRKYQDHKPGGRCLLCVSPSCPKYRAKGMKRKTRLKTRGNTSHARRERDFEHMAWVSTRPCLARLLDATGSRCAGRIHVHHMAGRYGADSDRKTVPLCEACHRGWHGHSGVFAGWSKERRRDWAIWSIEYTQIERRGGVL